MFAILCLTSKSCAAGYLVADQVLASTADTMRQTIEYVIGSWGSAQGYAKDALSLSAEEISAIRVNVMVQAEPSGMPLLARPLDQAHGRACSAGASLTGRLEAGGQ